MHAGHSFARISGAHFIVWHKDTITNGFDLSSIFIVYDVEYNINMPSQIIVIVREVYTNMSGQKRIRRRKKIT